MNETELVYSAESYLQELNAIIIGITSEGVILDKTIFYPQGGGQPSDRGTLIGIDNDHQIKIIGMKRDGGKLIHIIADEQENKFIVGDKVNAKIDWDYRYKLMKHHTSLHVLSAVVYRKFEAKVTGGTIYEDKARLDFDLPELNRETALELVKETNEELQKGHKISVEFVSREEADSRPELIRTKINLLPASVTEIRLVKIGDVDLQADGGLHVKSTDEIGIVELKKIENKGKGRKRISIGTVE
ncbi:MAG: Alanyl-tRNA editing protein AlaX-M [Candidatus Heimdallarchaeota archaeon LC_2]|nr:MAG: Alanyl-tRNA editing protein AlaX-M [Candidatus Heimdallarchaeota archaeon LC_2]